MSVLHDLDYQQKACIHAMRHTPSSSISLYHSSRVPIGFRIVPTLTGSVSRKLGLLGLLLLVPCFSDDPLQLYQFLRGKLRDGFFDFGKCALTEPISPRTPSVRSLSFILACLPSLKIVPL